MQHAMEDLVHQATAMRFHDQLLISSLRSCEGRLPEIALSGVFFFAFTPPGAFLALFMLSLNS